MNLEVGQKYRITRQNDINSSYNIQITRIVGAYAELKYLDNEANYAFTIGGSFYKNSFGS